jgi:hypothetical protein
MDKSCRGFTANHSNFLVTHPVDRLPTTEASTSLSLKLPFDEVENGDSICISTSTSLSRRTQTTPKQTKKTLNQPRAGCWLLQGAEKMTKYHRLTFKE